MNSKKNYKKYIIDWVNSDFENGRLKTQIMKHFTKNKLDFFLLYIKYIPNFLNCATC